MALFRRLTSFNKSKKPGEDGKANGVNGSSTGTCTTAQPSTTTKSNTTNGYAPAAVKHEEPAEDVHAATRADVVSTFEQYAQLIHASRRPLPNQSGDGAYLEKDEPSGFWSDMRSIGIKDLKTVKHIIVRTTCIRCRGYYFFTMMRKDLDSI
jgi:linoleate 10R-lipoxygenase